MAKFLRIKEWAKYQHYKDRNPPWIKLYREMLTSYTWVVLDDASRLLAVVCLLLAAETDNKIPLDRDFIQRRAQLKARPDVRKLVEVEFAEVFDDQLLEGEASMLLASCTSETETEAETDTKTHSRAYRLPEEWIPKPAHYELAKELGVIVDMELPKFRDHFIGSGGRKLDWDRTFNNWMRNSLRYGGKSGKDRGNTNTRPIAAVARKLNNGARFAEAFGDTSVGDHAGANGSRHAPNVRSGTGRVLEAGTGGLQRPGDN